MAELFNTFQRFLGRIEDLKPGQYVRHHSLTGGVVPIIIACCRKCSQGFRLQGDMVGSTGISLQKISCPRCDDDPLITIFQGYVP